MDNEKKSMIKDALILFAITLAAGLLLGFVYDVTKEPIAEQKAKAKAEACKNVFAEAESFEALAGEDGCGLRQWRAASFYMQSRR